MSVNLNLGCGDDIRANWHNVDVVDAPGIDEVYDLESTPWPWADDAADRILLDNVFEHLSPDCRPAVIDECARVLRPNGTLAMVLPVPGVGVGWDITHHPIPSWRWPFHPRHRDDWRLRSVAASKVGPGRVLPEPLARLLTRFGIARCVDAVRVEVTPT